MKPLSDTLRAAQQTPATQPVVRVIAANRRHGVVQLDFTRLYSGFENEYFHSLAIAGDGSLIRVRLTTPAEGRRLFIQRVENPSENSDFGNWTDSGRYNIVTCAVAACGSQAYICWARPDRRIEMLASSDCGASWGEVEVVDYLPTTDINGLCAACKPNGDMALFIAGQDTLYVKQRRAGLWQPRTVWDKISGPLSGAAACYDGDWNLFVPGQDAQGNYVLWSLLLGDGTQLPEGQWSELYGIGSAPAGGDFSYAHAFLAYPDVLRAFYVERHSGAEPWSRVYRADSLPGTSITANLWCEGVPFEAQAAYGLAAAHHGGFCWLSSASGVWRAPLAVETRDLSPLVTALEQRISTRNGTLTVEIGGGAPGDGWPDFLVPGGEIGFQFGFVTPQGEELSAGWRYQLVSAGREAAPGSGVVTLRVADGWEDLRCWQARRLFRWNGQGGEASLRRILEFVLARAGLRLEIISSSGEMDTLFPDFVIPPGANGETVVRSLLGMVEDEIFIEAGSAYLIYPQEQDTAVYAYGGRHAILETAIWNRAAGVNAVQAEGMTEQGSPLLAETFNWPQAQALGERLRRVEDSNLSAASEVQKRAQAVQNRESRKIVGGELTIPPNCAHELYDAIDITSEELALNDARHVIGWQLEYRPRQGRFRQRLMMGGV